MLAQSETWSDDKHHNTWKVLVGVTPNAQVSFISDLWGGTSFRQANHTRKWCSQSIRAWWQCHGWQGLWYFRYCAKWHNSKHASFLGWKGSDDWGRNSGNYEHSLFAHTCRTSNWEDKDLPYTGWNTSKHFELICLTNCQSLCLIDKLSSSITKVNLSTVV